MRALIIEDEEFIRKGLVKLLDLIDFEIDILGECESVKQAVIVANSCKPDLVFLDINLLDGTGFDFLEQTENLSFRVIFITAYEEYILQALRIGAVDYLLKPVDIEELERALNKVFSLPVLEQKKSLISAKQAWSRRDEKIILSLQEALQVIYLNELIYCESDKGYTTFYCVNNKKYIASKTIKEFDEVLTSNNFVRCHRSYMVNLSQIDKYDKSGIIHLKDGITIPVSSRKKDFFLQTFLNLK